MFALFELLKLPEPDKTLQEPDPLTGELADNAARSISQIVWLSPASATVDSSIVKLSVITESQPTALGIVSL